MPSCPDIAASPHATERSQLSEFLLMLLLCEVGASRTRILGVADRERRRIERDLHDGAQQRLVALRIRLELAAERLDESHADTAALLREFGADAEAALEQIRSVACGAYPAVLRDHGLAAALRAAARHAPIPTTVLAEAGRRYRPEVETAAYFCCLEAIQNATKHAARATSIRVTMTEREDTLAIEVRDDGSGFDLERTEPGAGLTNMRDRLAALGGRLHVDSTPDTGTRVVAAIRLHGPARRTGATTASAERPPRRATL